MEAIASYEEFVKLYPKHDLAPYAFYMLGECYRIQVKSPEKDLTYLKKASEYYKKVMEKFPQSDYAKKARERIRDVEELMARHEFVVGSFYYRLRKYNAAAGRFKYIVDRYKNTSVYYKALYYLGKSYLYLGQDELAERCFLTLLEGFQGGEYSLKAMKVLEEEFGYRRDAFKSVERMEVKAEDFFRVKEKEKELLKVEKGEKKAVRVKGEKKRKKATRIYPVTVEAKRVESFRKENKVVFIGDVIVKQRDLFLYAERVEAFLAEEGRGIKKLIARGNVRIIQGERFGRCDEADFVSEENIIILKGNPQVWYGENTIAGDKIVIKLDENIATVESKDRVKAVIYPEEVK